MAVPLTDEGEHLHPLAERRNIVGGCDRPAHKDLAILQTRRDDVFFRRLTHRQDVSVLIDDGFANNKYMHATDAPHQLVDLLTHPVLPQMIEMLVNMWVEDIQVLID